MVAFSLIVLQTNVGCGPLLTTQHRWSKRTFNYVIHFLSLSLKPTSEMPVSRLTRSINKTQAKKHSTEIKYTEQRTRSGALHYVAVNVPTSSTSSPSASRQSTEPLASHMMDIDPIDLSL